MASTYSNLKIQLMATGENTTTWGDVTNVNLGTALEEAIVGSADVTFSSGNVTLTLTNTNSTQAARNMRLVCTGTTGGSTRNLIVPAIEKPYIVQNDCADSIVIKNSTGTGVTVPAGKSMWVYNNGTNVVEVTTYLSSLSVGSISLSSPLGTGSGGTGSNATTYCNLEANVSGTLPVANGGTGGNTASTARTGLGATTVGASMFTLTNPGAITFPRFNADNTVSALSAADARTAMGAAASGSNGDITALTNSAGIQIGSPTGGAQGSGTINATGLYVNGSAVSAGTTIPSGTKMLFVQTAAPTGWTKDTTHNNKALRVVSGTASSGGSVAFTTAFASQSVAGTVGGTAITEAQMPSHTHYVAANTTNFTGSLLSSNYLSERGDTGGSFSYDFGGTSTAATVGLTSSTGSGDTHTHTFTGTAINLAVQYVDVIVATKD